MGWAGTERCIVDAFLPAGPLVAAADRLDVAAATVEATAASNGLCAPLSPAFSSTVSDPSSFRRVIVEGCPASAADLLGAVAAVLLEAPRRRRPQPRVGGEPGAAARILACRTPPAASANRQQQRGPTSGTSADSLQVGGEVADVLGRQAFGDGLHDAVRPGRAGARGIVVQLLRST